MEFSAPPQRSTQAFGKNAMYNQKKCHQLAQSFFIDAVKRARDRRERYGL